MARRVKVKKMKMKAGASDIGDIGGMFEEMMGIKDAEVSIIRPKIVKVRNDVRAIHKILTQFSNFVIFKNDFPTMATALEEIHDFANDIEKSLFPNGSIAKVETEASYFMVEKAELNRKYSDIKENEIVKKLIIVSSILKRHKRYIDDKDNLKDNFIGKEPGIDFKIFPFTSLDLKHIWSHDNTTPLVKKYILTILNKLWKTTLSIYKTITSPNVDIGDFTKVIIESLKGLKKHPELSRCHGAFKRIEESVGLLSENFDGYYRDSVSSGNPNILIENYILDVSTSGGAENDASLTREFRMIVQFMHKLSKKSGKSKDPNVQKIFSMLNQNFDKMGDA